MKSKTSASLITACIVLFTASISFSQKSSVYIPRNIEKAYEKGTRSYDGKPGASYWVNSTDYKIQAEVFPKEHTVKGSAQIKYYNQSSDTLKQMVMRLYQDINKKGNPHDSQFSPNDATDGVQIDTLIINGKGIDTKVRGVVFRRGTNMTLNIYQTPLLPNSSIDIEIKWSVIIPRESRLRMGAYNDSTLYVAYWYPQVAVYDDIDGWDRHNYTGEVEFYNDQNNYELEITVPAGYLVWGTGVYQNLQEILKPEIYSRYQEALNSDGIIRIVREEDLKNGATIKNEKTTWKLKADNVSDVSFATTNGYVWDGISAEVDEHGRRVLTDAVYPTKSKSWEKVAYYAKLSVENLSKQWPGVPFPYFKITVFNGETMGGGGMEMPMMCNNGMSGSEAGQAGVTLHEIAHNYFPFYMGTNERKYAWMDEGWATFFTSAMLKDIVPGADEFTGNVQTVGRLMGVEMDQPMITPSLAGGPMLNFNSYNKASVSYYVLKDLLGDELFTKALHEYMNRWHGKHPLPWDFMFTFNDVAKEDLSWFWNPWYFDRGFPDLGIKSVKSKSGNTQIIIEKIGKAPVPIDLIVSYSDSTTESIHKSTSSWKSGNNEVKIDFKTNKEIQKVELNTKLVPDANEKNNVFEVTKK
ncbi:MAG: peptidase [Ignavibacteriae bacterium HGW-Ignavibacteriae-3]|nr:MAG: peptidase [Ignavibacteriae bacterium HGW-Ignavibacteriae-3]